MTWKGRCSPFILFQVGEVIPFLSGSRLDAFKSWKTNENNMVWTCLDNTLNLLFPDGGTFWMAGLCDEELHLVDAACKVNSDFVDFVDFVYVSLRFTFLVCFSVSSPRIFIFTAVFFVVFIIFFIVFDRFSSSFCSFSGRSRHDVSSRKVMEC